MTGYAVFMVIETFFPPPTIEDQKIREWIKMIPLDKDASIWPDPPTLQEGHSVPTSSGNTDPASIYVPLRSYGAIRPTGDLIDLESGRRTERSVFSHPSIDISQRELDLLSSVPTRYLGQSTSAESVDTDATLVPSGTSIGDILANLLATRPKQPKYLKLTVLATLLLWALVFARPLPDQTSLSAPLMEHTPLSVACIIPQPEATSADLIYLSQTVSGRVKLIIWPDDLLVGTEWQRDVLVEEVHQAIGVQYGVWTLISALVKDTGVKERILVGVDGGVKAGQGGTDWTVWLPP
jgi:hypothetical protein